MSVSIPQSFVQQFEREAHLAYQRMGTKLTGREMVRRKDNIVGKQTTFQVIGKGTAGSKPRHGAPAPLNLSHAPVPCPLYDRYGLEFIDDLDELKVQHDERMAVSTSISAALGRASDEFVVDVLDADNGTVANVAALTQATSNAAREYMDNNDVPNDGMRYAITPSKGWSDLQTIDEFSSLDYIQAGEQVFSGYGTLRKRWDSFVYCEFSGLTTFSSRKRVHYWHRASVGFASGSNIKLTIAWENKEAMFSFNGRLSQGACVIDANGHYCQDLALT